MTPSQSEHDPRLIMEFTLEKLSTRRLQDPGPDSTVSQPSNVGLA
jgi:hypothetical protein